MGDRPTMVFNNDSRVENDPIRQQRIAMFEALNLTQDSAALQE